MVDTDVLIATRESDLYHMLLLLPNSVVIAFESNHLHYPRLNVLAEVASLYYLPVVNTDIPLAARLQGAVYCAVCRGATIAACSHSIWSTPQLHASGVDPCPCS